ncbi:hypothetical protein PFISCL1PPCAC_14192, partial [Pristionchus fissidentatus]
LVKHVEIRVETRVLPYFVHTFHREKIRIDNRSFSCRESRNACGHAGHHSSLFVVSEIVAQMLETSLLRPPILEPNLYDSHAQSRLQREFCSRVFRWFWSRRE